MAPINCTLSVREIYAKVMIVIEEEEEEEGNRELGIGNWESGIGNGELTNR